MILHILILFLLNIKLLSKKLGATRDTKLIIEAPNFLIFDLQLFCLYIFFYRKDNLLQTHYLHLFPTRLKLSTQRERHALSMTHIVWP